MQTNDLCLEENKDNLLWRVELKNLKMIYTSLDQIAMKYLNISQ